VARKQGYTGDDANNLITPEILGKDDTEKLINFSPTQG
jgi:hypothetical protein